MSRQQQEMKIQAYFNSAVLSRNRKDLLKKLGKCLSTILIQTVGILK